MRDTVITLFDDSANLFDDWLAAGYRVVCVDILNPLEGGKAPNGADRVYGDLMLPFSCPVPLDRIAFVNARAPTVRPLGGIWRQMVQREGAAKVGGQHQHVRNCGRVL